VPHHSDFNDLDCQIASTATADPKGNKPQCKTLNLARPGGMSAFGVKRKSSARSEYYWSYTLSVDLVRRLELPLSGVNRKSYAQSEVYGS
jgi:hypothetical protein